MNSSYNYSDFTSLGTVSREDYCDRHGAESLQLVEATYSGETRTDIKDYSFVCDFDRYSE